MIKNSYLYVVQEFDKNNIGACKIGLSDKPELRLSNLQIGNPRELSLVLTIGPMARGVAEKLESDLHKYHSKQHIRGEWYKFTVIRRLANMDWKYLPHGTKVKTNNSLRSK